MFGIDLNTLTKELQKKFASSATVSLIPGKNILFISSRFIYRNSLLSLFRLFSILITTSALIIIYLQIDISKNL